MQQDANGKDGKKRRIRCAVYTRKSTTEGLDQDFNTLDAQRESCEKYVESQKGEGWTLWPERYDDGGFTGGNTDRPALQKLLGDVQSGKIDAVVVYKVDRLSRSLLDFSRMIELFDRYNVAFVAVTQQFSTNTSMGRLTLNVLLSFAQFEREIISERTRDKMAAARQKGKWLGGFPPLGYDRAPDAKKLVANPEEAKLVCEIFDLYLKHRSILEVVRILNARGATTKRQTSKAGKTSGGSPFRITSVQHLLSNVLYTGHVSQGGKLYPGEHEAVLAEGVFQAAERIRGENRQHRTTQTAKGPPALLKGVLRCRSCGCAMIHTYSQKNGKRYRYYVCTRAQKQGRESCPEPAVNAQSIEEAAVVCLRQAMDGRERLKDFFAFTWETLFPAERARIFRSVLERLDYDAGSGALNLALDERGIQELGREIAPAAGEAA